jgi:hypothetical protein
MKEEIPFRSRKATLKGKTGVVRRYIDGRTTFTVSNPSMEGNITRTRNSDGTVSHYGRATKYGVTPGGRQYDIYKSQNTIIDRKRKSRVTLSGSKDTNVHGSHGKMYSKIKEDTGTNKYLGNGKDVRKIGRGPKKKLRP